MASFFVRRSMSSLSTICFTPWSRIPQPIGISDASWKHCGVRCSRRAKLAYQSYQRMLASPRWKALAEKGRRRSACCGPAQRRIRRTRT